MLCMSHVCVLWCILFSFSPAKALAEFDSGMASLSKWCNQWGEPASLLPKVGEVIAVKGAETGQWVRAKVSRQVSVRYVYMDTD